MIPLSQQLECAREVLSKMRVNRSRWIEAQESVVGTLERAEMLREISDELLGRASELVAVRGTAQDEPGEVAAVLGQASEQNAALVAGVKKEAVPGSDDEMLI